MNKSSPTRRPSTLRRLTARTLTASLMAATAGAAVGLFVGVTPAAGQGTTPAAAPAAPADPVGNADRGFRKAATCLGCHSVPGYKADFPVVYSVPMLGGQNAKYIENALKEYQKGERRFPSMVATAKSLSDQDIADVAAYFSSLR
jgi:cytochrome c553